MKFIKLTTPSALDSPLYIKADTILAAINFDGKNWIQTSYKTDGIEIVETPEEVLRMLGAWEFNLQTHIL
jgi:alpha-glucuronidase